MSSDKTCTNSRYISSTTSENELKIGILNVCGIKTRSQTMIFVVVQSVKLIAMIRFLLTTINFLNNIEASYSEKICWVRKPFDKDVQIIDSNSNFIFWIKLKTKTFPENEPLIIGVFISHQKLQSI